MLTTAELFDLTSLSEPLRALLEAEWPWEVLARLDDFFINVDDERKGTIHPTAVLEGKIYMAETACIGPHAYVKGPVWLGENAEVGHGAYLRGTVLLAQGAKVMHSCEAKRSLFLPGAKAAHFNYVGDSLLGSEVNLGAGVKLANFKTFGNEIKVDGQATGLRKFGAAIGDGVALGCNAVTSPGTVIGPRSIVYNGAMVRGVVPADTVVKTRPSTEFAPRT